jgi:hypothetical protein
MPFFPRSQLGKKAEQLIEKIHWVIDHTLPRSRDLSWKNLTRILLKS